MIVARLAPSQHGILRAGVRWWWSPAALCAAQCCRYPWLNRALSPPFRHPTQDARKVQRRTEQLEAVRQDLVEAQQKLAAATAQRVELDRAINSLEEE